MVCNTLSKIWNHLSHKVKTAHGTSISSYSASPEEFHAGAGEGSCLALLIWNTFNSQILTINEEVPYIVTIHHAEAQDPVSGEAYVDDTSYMINAHDLEPDNSSTQAVTLAQRLTKVAQHAERTLYATGGALELSKCCWYALTWKSDPNGAAQHSVH